MSKLLFNINDLALVLVIAASLLQASIFSFHYNDKKHSIFLSLFLLTIAIVAFDSLIYWSVEIKSSLSAISPHVFFIFKTFLFVQPVLLYFYTKSVIYYDFEFSRRDMLHFSPALAYFLAIPLIYYCFSFGQLEAAVNDYGVMFANPVFKFFMWLSKILYFIYGGLSLRVLFVHRKKLKDALSNTEGLSADWLQLLVVGFVSLWLWSTLAQLLTQFHLSAHGLSLFNNYAYLFLIVALVFLSLSRASSTHKQSAVETNEHADAQAYTQEQVQRVDEAMRQRKAYLDPDLSLEKLAKITSLPRRLLSSIVNHHFHMNFFELVNDYRVEHAKLLLEGESDHLTMIEVMAASGFNSKSAFNRFFKKIAGMTPTQYKLMHAKKSRARNPATNLNAVKND